MIEPEMAFVEHEESLEIQENYVSFVVQSVLKNCTLELQALDRDISSLEKVQAPFPRITYDEAIYLTLLFVSNKVSEAKSKRGYRIVSYPEKISENTVRWGLETKWLGKNVIHREVTSSTQIIAHNAAKEHKGHGTIVIADEQTSGRGRMNRDWHSKKGDGMWMSMILQPSLPPYLAPPQQQNVGCMIIPNFAVGAVLMMKFAKMAATYFPQPAMEQKGQLFPFIWIVLIVGGCIGITLTYVSWRKYRGEKKNKQDKTVD